MPFDPDPNTLALFRENTKNGVAWDFKMTCSRCKKRRPYLGHRRINGIKICKECLEQEQKK